MGRRGGKRKQGRRGRKKGGGGWGWGGVVKVGGG